jgi:hypothetical protein
VHRADPVADLRRTFDEMAVDRRVYGLAVTSLMLCVACQDAPKVQDAVPAELPECRVGDTCRFRPAFGSALVFTNLRAYDRFRRSKLETPNES